jgi:hypothetical protein
VFTGHAPRDAGFESEPLSGATLVKQVPT